VEFTLSDAIEKYPPDVGVNPPPQPVHKPPLFVEYESAAPVGPQTMLLPFADTAIVFEPPALVPPGDAAKFVHVVPLSVEYAP
jgi:hypothetical protein